jgi:hypothetical protein
MRDLRIYLFILNSARYGTLHVLVLADFPPSTRTIELEKLFQDFNDRGFVIRWVNDTTALAVFQTPAVGNYISTNLIYILTSFINFRTLSLMK